MALTKNRRDFLANAGILTGLAVAGPREAMAAERRPNIVWVVAEDASPHLGCYGEKTIKTPMLDAMAAAGVRFDAAFVTCPVCSPCRSAMVTGMYQTTLGAHHHRSQGTSGKAAGNTAYYDSYRLPVKLIPELFRDAGYYVTLGGGADSARPGKTDYNFAWDSAAYDGADWRKCPDDKPFFAQIMLSGGKNRGAKKHGTDPDGVSLPPYYPDHPVLREDWANYLNSWVQIDVDLGEIFQSLEEAGVADNTVVFFMTDHGISHLRGKQFLYEEGIRVPYIVKFPGKRHVGEVRDDLIIHIDTAATSLALAGIPIPGHLQGRDLFASNYQARDAVFSARDRCDETPDTIRCVRTKRYKYIRNFMAHLPHAQPNQYKDGKQIVKTMRALHAEGKLNELQSRFFTPTRPTEELYDLEKDPLELTNLAEKPGYADVSTGLREKLYAWMIESRDLALIPEPILEDLGRDAGNKYHIFRGSDGSKLLERLITVVEACEKKKIPTLKRAASNTAAALRYWGATGLGLSGDTASVPTLEAMLGDSEAGVRIAAGLALSRLGGKKAAEKTLITAIGDENVIAGMYAIRAIEMGGLDSPAVRAAVAKARDNRYEFTRRIAKRLMRERFG